jgi:hypothetical protein
MRTVPIAWLGVLAAVTVASGGCDMGKITVNTTSKVLIRAQPSLKMESDYELAARAIPGALKTIEGFWVVDPENENLRKILTEGYCQYGTGFVEDEYEQATVRKDFDAQEYHAARATKMFLRCMNYALMGTSKSFRDQLFTADAATIEKLINKVGSGNRTDLMWAGLALGSAINMNKDRVELVSHLDTVGLMLRRVIALDEGGARPKDKVLAAMPYIALGLMLSARSEALGGDLEGSKAAFEKAMELTDHKFLLAYVYFARRYAVMKQDKKLFHDTLMKVLTTEPSIWPEQRLANEIAHRRARRYLQMEKELFP